MIFKVRYRELWKVWVRVRVRVRDRARDRDGLTIDDIQSALQRAMEGMG
jgi:hypothetical protein